MNHPACGEQQVFGNRKQVMGVLAAEPTMTRTEVTQWLLICRSLFLSAEDSFLQHQGGALDQAAFGSYCAGVRSFMSQVGFRAAWKTLGGQFGRDFGYPDVL
jgi:hypothetical protein